LDAQGDCNMLRLCIGAQNLSFGFNSPVEVPRLLQNFKSFYFLEFAQPIRVNCIPMVPCRGHQLLTNRFRKRAVAANGHRINNNAWLRNIIVLRRLKHRIELVR